MNTYTQLLRLLILLLTLAGTEAIADDPINCAEFWSMGSPLTGTNDHDCYEYPLVFGSDRVRVFYEPDWIDDALIPHIDSIVQATQASIDALNDYGEMSPIYILFSVEDAEIPDGHLNPAAVAVQSNYVWPEGDEPCPLLVFPWSIDGWDMAEVQQHIAHEVFHCFQVDHFYEQLRGPEFRAQAWWSEGTATYFINAPYPDGDLEHIPQARYEPDLNLTSQSYATTGFFQSYKASGPGRAGILALINSMPTGGDFADQHMALSGVANIEQHFHEFGERYLDRAIPDDGGGRILIAPEESPVTVIEETGNYEFEIAPFTLGHNRLQFSAGATYNISVRTINGNGRETMRRAENPETWEDVPEEIKVDCSEDEDYLLLNTSTEGPGENKKIVLIVERVAREDCCNTGANLEPSLIGHWRAEGQAAIEAVYPFPIGARGAEGKIDIIIRENGQFTQQYMGLKVFMTVEYPNAPTITFVDHTNGVVSGCLMAEPMGAMGALNIKLQNRQAQVGRTFSLPNGDPESTRDEHIGLAFGIPAGNNAIGLIKPLGADAFYNKKVLYSRISRPQPEP